MGNRPSQDAFAAVLPADRAAHQAPVSRLPTKSLSSHEVDKTDQRTEPETSLAGSGDPSPVSSELLSPQVTCIEPPAHALQLQDPGAATPRAAPTDEEDDSRFLTPESVRKSRTLEDFQDVCSEILPNFLFVSNLVVAQDTSKLRELGITHVVNCCKELCSANERGSTRSRDAEVSSPEPAQPQRKELRLALHDDVREDLLWFFYQIVAFIESARAQNGCVLVHCHQGISRSCAFVIAYIMHQQQQQQQSRKQTQRLAKFRDALAFVKARRPIASPNTAFLCQLIEWDCELATFSASTSNSENSNSVLYRLAPHAAHDPETLVLKCCYTPDSQRQRVNFDSSTASPRQWLFSRGVFVFVRSSTTSTPDRCEIVIWKGAACELPDARGVAIARALVEQMVRVRLGFASKEPQPGDLAQLGVEIVEVVEEAGAEASATCSIDHFGYAEELGWLLSSTTTAALKSTSRNPNDDKESLELHGVSGAMATLSVPEIAESEAKPQLFILEGVNDEGTAGAWDRLREYDSDDLTSGDAFLLFQSQLSSHFLWIGADSSAQHARETLVRCAESHVRALRRENGVRDSGCEIAITSVNGGDESDEFWNAFERGY